ncbi:MAG: DUF3391 domain-containing protein [Oleiphilaceae bacterium]|nr:DUF3391 domain-containing protein [Oleiphilaceae bacterium]
MSVERVKTAVSNLQEGMFVADLDRPWHETPFPLQGFYIRAEDDRKAIAQFCSHVFIDSKKTRVKNAHAEHAAFNPSKASSSGVKKSGQATLELPEVVIKSPESYKSEVSIQKEAARVKRLHQQVNDAVRNICESVANGEQVSVQDTQKLAVSMVVSVVRNPDALIWLAKMDDEDQQGYQHVVRASIWALVFARHLGLTNPLMKSLAVGVLLSHIGKVKLEQSVRDAEPEDSKQNPNYQSYVQHSLDILKECDGLPDSVLSIVEFHAERHNGSGFPKGVTGQTIPLLAKIAGLVDEYQTMITPRGESKGLSPREAVAELYEQRNVLFQKDLVERFIEAIGVFPTGTLVELSTQEVGIVTGHNSERRLLPQIIVVTDKDKKLLKSGRKLDLKAWNESHSEAEALYIKDSLPKGAFGIDENAFLLSGATSKWSLKHIMSGM